MDYAQLYQLINLIALVPWLLLFIAPRWVFTQRLVYSFAFVLLFCSLYLVLFSLNFDVLGGGGTDGGSFATLAGLKLLFQSDAALVIGWTHYLAFDLFVGIWEVRDAQEKGIAHYWLIPCLLLTLMAGPIGFLLYWLVQYLHGKR
mgnify:CR=1 FL=1|jgi:hypothetical protein